MSSDPHPGDSSSGSPSSSLYRARGEAVSRLETKFTMLDKSYCEQLVELEQRCYSHPWSPDLIRGEFDKEVSFRCGLVSAGTIYAYCLNYLIIDELHVLNLAVSPDYRGRGLGKKLLVKVLETAYTRGARFATLEVRPSNYVAKKLYSTLGFEVVGLRKNYYRDNYENALVLECKLDNLTFRAGRLVCPTSRMFASR